jgi:ABC-type bacteriocin/lantibiotic exporter with double-glycine peptidase domain
MPKLLSVPYHPQNEDGYCLAACAQMVLHYWGVAADQNQLARQLGVEPGVGVPAGRIQQLVFSGLAIVYDIGEWETLMAWLDNNVPMMAMIQAGELSQWSGEYFQHAVVVIGYDESLLWLLDPAVQPEPLGVSIDEFMLAWGEMDYRYAVISRLTTTGDESA